jgi:CBS domain-containing protein
VHGTQASRLIQTRDRLEGVLQKGLEKEVPMKIRDIMTEPVMTCVPEASLATAARLMQDADCGTVPVVDSRGRLAGIVTDRDICLAVAASNRSAINITVHEVMTHKVLSAQVDDDVLKALATMKGSRVRRLPVRDDAGQVVGIVSIEDVVLRGLQGGGVKTTDIIDALRAMYVRSPATGPMLTSDEFTPG